MAKPEQIALYIFSDANFKPLGNGDLRKLPLFRFEDISFPLINLIY